MKDYYIYLAGGMSGLSLDEQDGWRTTLKEKFELCGIATCVNPVDYYSYFNPDKYDSELEVMRFDLHQLKRCDLVIVNFNKTDSLGTMAELGIAYDNRIPVIGLNENQNELHPWQKEMCSKIFTNIEELYFYVCDYYLF